MNKAYPAIFTRCLRWLLENRDEGCTESAVDGACWNGHEATVRWLICEWRQAGSERALDYAASTGRLEVKLTYYNAGFNPVSVAVAKRT